jgi:hypothetical protein
VHTKRNKGSQKLYAGLEKKPKHNRHGPGTRTAPSTTCTKGTPGGCAISVAKSIASLTTYPATTKMGANTPIQSRLAKQPLTDTPRDKPNYAPMPPLSPTCFATTRSRSRLPERGNSLKTHGRDEELEHYTAKLATTSSTTGHVANCCHCSEAFKPSPSPNLPRQASSGRHTQLIIIFHQSQGPASLCSIYG